MPEAPKPKSRGVASGVVNLGNTCYMNAVLQALAHAPELCMAMDVEPHRVTCPVAERNAKKRRNSPSPPDETSRKRSIRKSLRSGKKSPTNGSNGDSEIQFCTLCELENHLSQVHSGLCEPVAPTMFVNGFIDHVAPWFRLGVQEDSHEFLRLLIDAMQKSCSRARKKGDSVEGEEYSFKLFRGTVESNVRCSSCSASSSKIDPIEDIGLEVTSTSSSSLTDVSSALERFTRAEPLDSGYKCDKCGNMGKATKQSRLASIPPILTLHLKRFRYGSDGKPILPPPRRGREVAQLIGSSGSAKIEGHIRFPEFFDLKPFMTPELSSQHKNMYCRLFAVIVHAGKNSHSGHYIAYIRNISKKEWWRMDDARVTRVGTEEVFGAEAYMLLYRVVDHTVAQQLRAKDSKAKAEASPKVEVEPKVEAKTEEVESKKDEAPAEDATRPSTSQESAADDTSQVPKAEGTEPEPPMSDRIVSTEGVSTASEVKESAQGTRKRKRSRPEFANSEEWALAKTNLPPDVISMLREAEEFLSDKVKFKPGFLKLLSEEAGKGGKFNSSLLLPSGE